MTQIEMREQLPGKIVKARAALASREGDTGSQRRQRDWTSPADHYHISKYARTSHDLTEWLSELPDDDLAVVVRLFYNILELFHLMGGIGLYSKT
jgi:hypothetical protein